MQAGPDFVCVGAQKAGTQWLYDQLAWHPEFWMPPVKELHYLDRSSFRRHRRSAAGLRARARFGLRLVNAVRERNAYRPLADRDLAFLDRYVALLGNGEIDLEGYAGLFIDKGDHVTGDITPGYSRLDEHDIEAFAARFPDVRIVYLARDPIERVWSHLLMTARRSRSIDRVHFDRALNFARRPMVRLRCTNTEVIERWRRHMPAERIGVFLFDDIRDRPEAARRDIIRFLGADPDRGSGTLSPGFNRKSNERKLPLPDDLRAALAEEFADELRASATVLGGTAARWADKYGMGRG